MFDKIVLDTVMLAELTDQARHLIHYSLENKIKPMVAIVVMQSNGAWLGATMCLYACETKTDPDGKQTIPLTPFFYPYEVASKLVELGVLYEAHISQKTGVQVHWCTVTDNLPR